MTRTHQIQNNGNDKNNNNGEETTMTKQIQNNGNDITIIKQRQ